MSQTVNFINNGKNEYKAPLGFREKIEFIENVPHEWTITPLKGKKPFIPKWQTEKLSKSRLTSYAGDNNVTGYGLMFGEISNGLIGIDHDGVSVDEWIVQNTGLSVEEALPKTVTATSGREGRYCKIYRVPEKYWGQIGGRSILTGVKTFNPIKGKTEDEQIDFRWNGQQSVVFGIHPQTLAHYEYWEGCEYHTEIAECPLWVIKLIAVDTEKPKRKVTPEQDLTRAIEYLRAIDPEHLEWHDWRNILLACHDSNIEKEEVLTWSERSSKHDKSGFDDVWKYIKGGKENGRTIATLGYFAKLNGWKNPKQSVNIDDLDSHIENFPHDHIRYVAIGNQVSRIVYNELNGKWAVMPVSALKPFFMRDPTDKYGVRTKPELIITIDCGVQSYHHDRGLFLTEEPNKDTKYIGFLDGDYNTESNKLEPFDPSHNIWERWNLRYENRAYSPTIKDEFMNLFEFMTGDKYAARAMYLAKCCEVLKLGKQIWQMLIISGDSRTGKSSYCQSFDKLMIHTPGNKKPQLMDTKQKLQGTFGMSGITPLTMSLHVLELIIKTQSDMEWIKVFVDTTADIIIERKNENRYATSCQFMTYASVQDDFKIEVQDPARANRFVQIKLSLPKHAGQPLEGDGIMYDENRSYKHAIDEYFHSEEKALQLFWYILENESSELCVRTWNATINTSYFKEQTKQVTVNNDPLDRFFDENCVDFEISEDTEEFITGDDKKAFVESIKIYLVNECGYRTKPGTKRVHELLKNHISTHNTKLWDEMKLKITKGEIVESVIKIDGKSTRIIRGIKKVKSLVRSF